jgi:hypothetical protein
MLQLGPVPVILEAIDRQWENAVDLRTYTGSDVTGFSGYTIAVKMKTGVNLLGGTKTRVFIAAPNTAACSWSAMYIGEGATTGNAYNFATTPVQVTFGGKTSLTLAQKGTATSDPIALDFNPTKTHILAFNVSSSALRRLTTTDPAKQVISYLKAATSEAGTVAKASGYAGHTNISYGLKLVQAWRAVDL